MKVSIDMKSKKPDKATISLYPETPDEFAKMELLSGYYYDKDNYKIRIERTIPDNLSLIAYNFVIEKQNG